jgi:hypothetical protein
MPASLTKRRAAGASVIAPLYSDNPRCYKKYPSRTWLKRKRAAEVVTVTWTTAAPSTAVAYPEEVLGKTKKGDGGYVR